MAKRRRLWGRIVLLYSFLGVLMIYFVILLISKVFSSDRVLRDELAALSRDDVPPVIELRGGNSMTIAESDPLEEPGVSAYDDRSVPSLTINSEVDVMKSGEYVITYTAIDEAGNVAKAERKVNVIQPTGRIYLTFDDGPGDYTSQLLDVLDKYGVKATFFVTGYGDDSIIKREYNDGHTVGLHSMSHNYAVIYANTDSYFADLNAVRERVKRVTGQTSYMIRFPGGSSNLVSKIYDGGQRIMSKLVDEVSGMGYSYFDWNVDSDDAGGALDAESVYNNVTRALNGEGEFVILQHDVKPYSVEAVERIIKYGLEKGYVFSRLTEDSFPAHHGINN